MLEHLCNEFDNGRTEAALWIAVVLRTLLYTNGESDVSILDQLKKFNTQFNPSLLSTSFPRPTTKDFIQGWEIRNVCNTTLTTASVFMGLLKKILWGQGNGEYVVEVEPMRDWHSQKNRYLSFNEWLNEIIFEDSEKDFSLSRLKAIKVVANKEGGAHLDEKIPNYYLAFRSKDLLKIRCNGEPLCFTRNPVFVSIRQIAWELLESLKHSNII